VDELEAAGDGGPAQLQLQRILGDAGIAARHLEVAEPVPRLAGVDADLAPERFGMAALQIDIFGAIGIPALGKARRRPGDREMVSVGGRQLAREARRGHRLRNPFRQGLHGLSEYQRRDHAPYLVSISQPETSATKAIDSGRKIFHPSRISWS